MNVLYAATGDAIARITLEGGAAASAAVGLEGSGACCLAVDPRDPDRVYAGTFDHGLRVSDDGGLSWREPDVGPADERVLALAVSRAADVAYAGTEPSNLYRSDDAGRTWELLPALRELPSEPDWSFPGPPVDAPRAHNRAAPGRRRHAARGGRARRRHAFDRRGRELGGT